MACNGEYDEVYDRIWVGKKNYTPIKSLAVTIIYMKFVEGLLQKEVSDGCNIGDEWWFVKWWVSDHVVGSYTMGQELFGNLNRVLDLITYIHLV